ncbi:non-ribosomal peptide synthetase [Streptococcus ferus]|uniref:non-ribosomal peptide synthetase n=1 Tax=Streptococcus ferus TaxID=1345 RepID=UPI002355F300|nr:non-ribosomal peptide synthetase [Streptococcus ferus]
MGQNRKNKFPMTDIQTAYMLGRNPKMFLGGNSTHFYTEILTKLEPERFEKALNKVIKEQPMLRAIFLPEGVQEILDDVPYYNINIKDIRTYTKEEKDEELLYYREKTSHRKFSPEQWPLFDFTMFQVDTETYHLLVDFDMLIVDGFSTEILVNKIIEYYENENLEPEISEYTFEDHVYDHLKLLEQKREDEEKFWNKQIPKMPLGPELQYNIQEGKIYKFSQKEFIIKKDKWQDFKNQIKDRKVLPSLYLFTTFSKTLAKFCNQTDFGINMTLTNRKRKDSNIIGDFTENIPLDVHFRKNSNIFEVARDTQERLRDYRKFNTIGGVNIIKRISEFNELTNSVPYPVVFTSMLFDSAQSGWDKLGKRIYQISQTPQVLLDCNVMERQGSLILRWDYLEDCFENNFIDEMFSYYTKIIENEILNHYTDSPARLLWENYNDTNDDDLLTGETIQEIISKQSLINSDKIAFICGQQSITYKELERKSDIVCDMILSRFGHSQPIILESYRNINTVIWMVGVLKSGGYYIPIEPEWPDNRKQTILSKSGAKSIINVMEEKLISDIGHGLEKPNYSESELAYVIYTSGSTGEPKGVSISQKSVLNTIKDINRRFSISKHDTILNISSFCFDLSIYDIFGSLLAGATCVIMKDRTSIEEYENIFRNYPISVWNSVPALLEVVLNNAKISSHSLKTIMLSGDWIPLDLPQKVKKLFENSKIYSLGGATEASIWSIYYPINKVDNKWNSIPYGFPLSNQKIFVLDFENELCPQNVIGEICIGGVGIAQGYFNDPVRTNEQFFIHPEFGRLYKTGDFGYLSSDGYIVFKGRIDQQIKLHGYRIELGEIENSLNKSENIVRSAAIIDDQSNDKRIIGYVVPKRSKKSDGSSGANYIEATKFALASSKVLPINVTLQKYSSLLDQLDIAAVGIMIETLIKLNAVSNEGNVLTIEEIISKGLVSDKYQKVLEQWFVILKNKNFIQRVQNEQYILSSSNIDIDSILSDIIKDFPEARYWNQFFEFILACRKNMVNILEGNINPIAILFPDGDWARAENLYRNNPIAEYYNKIVAQAILGYIQSRDKKTKILEVGAGTGGTTYDILNSVKGNDIEYTYTDLSTFFTNEAKNRLQEFNFMKYALYSIDTEPQKQGFRESDYQIVIGANVLHDASDIPVALENLNKLLAKDGILVLLEATTDRLIQKVTVGLIEGFSNYNDDREEKKRPLLNQQEWVKILKENGYQHVSTYPVLRDKSISEQNVFIAMPEKRFVDVNINELEDRLKKDLPDYMLPDDIFIVENIPLSSNGKIKKDLLPRFISNRRKSSENVSYTPKNTTEAELIKIISDILELEFVSPEINFFEMGMDSLKAISFITKCKNRGFDVTMEELYNFPTIQSFSQHINKKAKIKSGIDYTNFSVPQHLNYDKYPLTKIQRAYLYGRNSAFELGNVSTHYYAEIKSNLEILKLEKSLNEVIQNQPTLRTIIHNDGMQQILRDTHYYKIEIIDISDKDTYSQQEILKTMRKNMSHKVHELGRWPMFDLKAVKTSENNCILCFSIDVMIADGASIQLLWNDIVDSYLGDYSLNLSFDFSNYVESVNNLEASELYKKDKKYWSNKVEDFPSCVSLPYKTELNKVTQPLFKRLQYSFTKGEWRQFKDVARQHRLTPSALLCSAYSLVLSRYSGSNNFALNMTMYNRYPFYDDIDRMIGDFTSTSIIDVKLNSDFWKQTQEIQKVIFDAMEHRHFDGIDFLKLLSKDKKSMTSAIMPVVFTCALFDTDFDSSRIQSIGEIQYAISQTPQVSLDNQITSLNGVLQVAWDYVDQLFDRDTISGMFNSYIEIIKEIASGKNKITIDDIELIKKVESYNNTLINYPNKSIIDLFCEQVQRMPSKEVIIYNNRSMSFSELDKLSNQVANYLSYKGYSGEGIAVTDIKSFETIAAIIGILKTGGYYVPISSSYPEARKEYIMEDSNSKLLITPKLVNEEVKKGYSDKYIHYDTLPDDIAYIIYTSGTTGNPKGVMISHKSVCNTVVDIVSRYQLNFKDRILSLSNFTFDLSVFDIFGAISCGATLILTDDYRNIHQTSQILLEQKITFCNCVPSVMQMVVNYMISKRIVPSVKNIFISGDWIPLNLINKIHEVFPNANITSLGGATEASIWSIYYPIKELDKDWKSIPYGYPLGNQKIYILDEYGQLSPIGVKGEICIGGLGVSKGYINKIKESKKHFVLHPDFGYLYRTGDIGVFHRKGYVEFLGRMDNQIKLNGYRVELDEISKILEKHELIESSISVINKDNSSEIISYLIPRKNKAVERNFEESARFNDSWKNINEIATKYSNKYPLEISPERYQVWSDILESKSLYIMLKTLQNLYDSAYKKDISNSVINIPDFIKKCGIKKKYNKVIKQWLLEFERLNYAKQVDENTFQIDSENKMRDVKNVSLEEYITPEEKQYFEESLHFLETSTNNLISLLKGEETILNLLFPEGDWEVAKNLYQTNPIAKYYNNIISKLIYFYLGERDDNIRILELGAGIGGTTESLLKELKTKNYTYIYTDISTYFTNKAKLVYDEYKDKIVYDIFDINLSPQEQGLELESYDVILAANMIHDAKNLDYTLNNIKDMLKPEGIFVVLEQNKNTKLQMITTAMIDGFSDYNDFRLKQFAPLLSANQWKELMDSQGFLRTSIFPRNFDQTYDQIVIVSQKDSLNSFLTHDELQSIYDYASDYLAKYMIPSKLVQLREFPLSTNGKVDIKLLPMPKSITRSAVIMKPTTKTEIALYKIWSEVLGKENFSIDENFYNIGGDSLKAIQILSFIKSDKEIDISKFIEGATIRELANYLESEGIEISRKR